MTNILLTGATGFVGAHLLGHLRNDQITVLGRSQPSQFGGEYIKTNFEVGESYADVTEGQDVIIHVAGRAHVMKDTEADPLSVYRAFNRDVTLALAQAAANNGVRRFIFISTIKVNGETTQDESLFAYSDVCSPSDPYAISKYEAEIGLQEICKATGMEFVIIRPPLIYGAGVKGNFGSILKLVAKPIPIPFGAVRTNKRSMVSVYNLVDLIAECVVNPTASNQKLLVSDNDDLSTRELFENVGRAMGRSPWFLPIPQVVFVFLGKLFQKSAVIERICGSLQVDIEHTCKLLGWQPPYSVEKSMLLTVTEASK